MSRPKHTSLRLSFRFPRDSLVPKLRLGNLRHVGHAGHDGIRVGAPIAFRSVGVGVLAELLEGQDRTTEPKGYTHSVRRSLTYLC